MLQSETRSTGTIEFTIPDTGFFYNSAEMRKESEFSYDGEVGRWWLGRSRDRAHARAYRRIAAFMRDSFVREPGVIVDYACGPGNLIALLSRCFSRSRLVGLDGSRYMLDRALRRFTRLPRRCARRISLIETPLPNMRVLRGLADLVVYCFPNMVPFDDSTSDPGMDPGLTSNDRKVARSLSLLGDPDDDAPANRKALEQGRLVSLNLRRLLARDGICIRVEYATMQRHELSPHELSHVSFEEGSLDACVDGNRPRQWFRLLASAYFRSGVLEDVYEQTGDERDRNGGYLITVLRAI